MLIEGESDNRLHLYMMATRQETIFFIAAHSSKMC